MVFWFYHRRPCWFTYLQTFLHSRGCGQNPGLPWALKGVEKYVFTGKVNTALKMYHQCGWVTKTSPLLRKHVFRATCFFSAIPTAHSSKTHFSQFAVLPPLDWLKFLQQSLSNSNIETVDRVSQFHFSQFTPIQVLGLTEILNEMPAVQRLHFMSLNFFSHFTTLHPLDWLKLMQ